MADYFFPASQASHTNFWLMYPAVSFKSSAQCPNALQNQHVQNALMIYTSTLFFLYILFSVVSTNFC